MDSYNKETIRNTYSAGLIHHLTLVVGLVCVGIGQTLLYTILGPASREIGISEFSVGIIVTIAALVITLSSGMWGRLIDRLGSRNAYLAGMIFYTTGTLFLGYGLHISVNHSISALSAFYLLLVIRSLTGFLTAGIHPAAMTYVAESTSSKERGAGIALIASAYGIGSIIGPILGSVIGKVSFLLPIFVASAISLLGVILGFFVLKPQKKSLTNKEKERILIRLTDKRVLPIFIGISLTYVGFSCFQQTLSFYVQDVFNLNPERSISKIGGLFATMAIFMIITQLLLIQIIKPSINFLLYCGMWSCVTGFMFLILTTQTFNGLYLACGFLGIGFGMMIPAIQSSASLAVTKDEQGGVSGFLFGASAFGYVIGPVLGTYIYSIDPNMLFLICIMVTFLSIFSTRIVLNKKQKLQSPDNGILYSPLGGYWVRSAIALFINRQIKEVSMQNVSVMSNTNKLAAETKPARMAAETKPARMAAETKPARMAAETKPARMAAETKPARMAAETKPARMAAETKPARMAAETKPARMAAETKPARMAAETKPARMAAETKPARMAAETKPARMAAETKPARMAAETKPARMAAETKPARMAAETKPARMAAETKPARMAAETKPARMAAETKPARMAAETKPARMAAETKPARMTAEIH